MSDDNDVIDTGGQQVVPAMPRRRAIRLSSTAELREELETVYRHVALGRLDSKVGSRLGYLLGELRKLHELDVLERRLEQLEALVNGRPR